MDCLFCTIINKEIPAEVVYEDDHALGILDVHPRAGGHTLILPKRHAYAILDLSDGEIGEVFAAVKKMTALLDEKLRPDGFTIGINQGATAGQAIEHLHIHIIPRFADDAGSSIHSVVNHPPRATLAETARKIRAHDNQ